MTNWQPIETYDYEGSDEENVLLADEDGNVDIGYCVKTSNGGHRWVIEPCFVRPTHWMPLPKHPKEIEND